MRKGLLIIVTLVVVVLVAGGAYVYFFAGRTVSRLTGGLVTHHIALPDCAEFIGVDFQESGGGTVSWSPTWPSTATTTPRSFGISPPWRGKSAGFFPRAWIAPPGFRPAGSRAWAWG